MREFLNTLGFTELGCVPLSSCKITKKYLLDKAGLSEKASVVMMLLPYRSEQKPTNLSVYASVRDYHKFVDYLRERLACYLNEQKISAPYAVFADHTPLDEVHAS